MFRRQPLLARILGFVVVPAVVAAAVGWWHLRDSLPPSAERIAVPGLQAPASVERDARGVPRVVAHSDRDAYFLIGYLHAQDRLWQLELQRRMAQGRLSEVLGKETVQQDIWFRTLGLSASARQAWTALSPQAQASLQAYADGINAWLDSKPALPAEFLALGVVPERWSVYDSLAWSKVFALDLGGNYRREIERMLAAQTLDPVRLRTLFPHAAASPIAGAAPATPAAIEGYARMADFHAALEQRTGLNGRYVGSNAWAVSAKLTGDGSTLLANDPHMGLQMPSLWYMASLKGDRLDVSGATLVGLPLVVFGRNAKIAWGGTNLMADAQDVYLEQVKPDDASRYLADGQWLPFEQRVESIQVRQSFPTFLNAPIKPLRVAVRSTRHGPVINDMFQVFEQPAALRWTALDADDTSYEAFYRLGYAGDWNEFDAAAGYLVAPALNLLYADRGGHVGHLAAGRIPLRAAGDGGAPVPGWTDEYAWTGSLPHAQMPRVYDPPSGFVASANNDPTPPGYAHLISHDWAPPTRVERIAQLIDAAVAAKQPVDLALMQRMQADQHSESARRLLKVLLRHEPNNPYQHRVYEDLRKWDGRMDRDSRAATVFNAWLRHLKRRLVGGALEGYWNRSRQNRALQGMADAVDPDTVIAMLSGRSGQWCRDRENSQPTDCDLVVDAALDDAVRELRKMAGDDVDDWAWGEVHQTVYRHAPFSSVNVLRSWFERRIGNGGSPDTLNVADYALGERGSYEQTFGAGFRQIVALAPGKTAHVQMNSTGQSGNVLSRHFDDMVEDFRDVRYADMAAAGATRTQLQPAPPASPAPASGAAANPGARAQ
ncbi:penicillin acylase family protein [Lysobacter sp. K5869]|uniref:penicillin acylase family protein n=1 Tax=Lysobacter sp. K5869 TaxID=2820808 RepID=UPI001C061820|nr:penicillin acylase family protein [Lysobacter sp. K5869]QWP75375.1 penicillin acylase family protein [Lysobacter sp. K5869]